MTERKVMKNSEYLFNYSYARLRGVTEQELEGMQSVYEALHEVLARPLGRNRTHQQAVQLIESFENTLQFLWMFEVDSAQHSYWYRVDGCECPKLDNSDSRWIVRRIINKNCPFHGDKL
jgi:hypothetical protein